MTYYLDPKNRRGRLRKGLSCWYEYGTYRYGCGVARDLTGGSYMTSKWSAIVQHEHTSLLPWEV
jgi:hypothetical protein